MMPGEHAGVGPIPVEKEYPGIAFRPPSGTVPSGELEGEALVKWRKVGDSYTIVEFEGKPISPPGEDVPMEEIEGQKDAHRMADALGELDAMGTMAG